MGGPDPLPDPGAAATTQGARGRGRERKMIWILAFGPRRPPGMPGAACPPVPSIASVRRAPVFGPGAEGRP